MKGYRARGHGVGTGPAKGAKFKRKQWKQKIAYAKSNFGKECDDDDNFNYNLVGAELPTVVAEGEGIIQNICLIHNIVNMHDSYL